MAVGDSIARVEDARLLTGRGRYVDDIRMAGTIGEIPGIEIHHVESPPQGPVDFRGVGESGAIEDALAPFGVRIRHKHLPPHRLLELIGSAS